MYIWCPHIEWYCSHFKRTRRGALHSPGAPDPLYRCRQRLSRRRCLHGHTHRLQLHDANSLHLVLPFLDETIWCRSVRPSHAAETACHAAFRRAMTREPIPSRPVRGRHDVVWTSNAAAGEQLGGIAPTLIASPFISLCAGKRQRSLGWQQMSQTISGNGLRTVTSAPPVTNCGVVVWTPQQQIRNGITIMVDLAAVQRGREQP